MARGDHIRTRRKFYAHHGIDAGDGAVIHFSGEPLRLAEAIVCRVSLEEFAQGQPVEVVPYEGETLDPDAVVAEAERHLNMTGYNLWQNNCEHFAWYCKTGKRQSRQVTRAVAGLAATAVTGAALFVAGRTLRAVLRARRSTTAG